jgi:DNA-binding MarR family transcriptional regulator
MQALLFLYNAHPSYRTIGSIAKKFVITPATASRLVDALEQKGLVQRTRLEEDRRAVRVELTVKGQRMIGRIVGVGEEIIKLFGVLPERECAKLAKSLKKILKAMQQKGYITASGICRTCDFFRAEVYAGKKLPHYCALTGERLSEEESYLERLDWVGETIL